MENKIDGEGTSKQAPLVSKKVESKGSATPIMRNPPLLHDDPISTEHCRALRFLLDKRISREKDVMFMLEEGEEKIYVTSEDVDQFLKMSWLNISILEIFIK